MKLIFASHNENKVLEIRNLLPETIEILSLKDIGFEKDILENGSTIEANAKIKSKFIFENFGFNNFSDDSGLEVEALNNEPGVFSARYAGNHKNDSNNIDLLLHNLAGNSNRNARFKTVISLCINGHYTEFTGIIQGTITEKPIGSNGFGYDSVFIPLNHTRTFAEMNLSEKSTLSHRGIALNQLIEYLQKI